MADQNYDPDRLQTERPAGPVTMTVRPQRLTRDEAANLVRKYNPDITVAAIRGEVDNIMRESGGKPAVPGDFEKGRATSGGLYQHHNTRLTELKSYAQKHGKDWTDPEIQVQFSRFEKERDYPSLLKAQQSVTDPAKAEDMFKRIFERPASVLWQNNAQGQPVLGNDQYRFSDYALGEHKNRPGTDIVYMPPADYLDLSPELNGKPFTSPSGRSLMKSFNRGDAIEAIPTLDVAVDGNTGTVTDQDGRHRALLAQHQGIEAIPVAVRQKGEGTPTEVVGMSGKVMPNDFVKASEMRQPRQETPQPEKAPISLMSQIGQAIIPGAQAAEPAEFWKQGTTPVAEPASGGEFWKQGTTPVGEPQIAKPGETLLAGAKGVAKGIGDTMFAGQELAGKGMQALGIPGGESLTADARQRMAAENEGIKADKAAHPTMTGVGETLGGMVGPMGIASKLVAPINALRSGAVAGGLSGLLTPEGSDTHFWRDKGMEAGTGAAAGAIVGKGINALGRAVAPSFRATVEKLMGEGVELTPGQMAGGAAKRAEDALGSIPLLGSAIRSAQRRSIETFNRAAINRSLDDISVKLPQGMNSGHDAIGFAQDQFRDAYKQIIPRMTGTLDVGLRNDLNGIMAKAQADNLPQAYLDQLQHAITRDVIEPFGLGAGRIDGIAAQKIGTRLDELINPLRRGGVYEQQMGQYLREADKTIEDMMARGNPMLQAAKDRVDAGYAKFKTVQSAATALGSKDGTFTPAQLSRAVRARDRSKDKAAFARGDAMMQDLSSAARDVLPQVVPDSGTPERAALMGLIGGGMHFEPHTGLTLAGLAVPYTKPVSQAVNTAMNYLSSMPFPRTQNALASLARGGGQVAAPIAGSVAGAAMQPRPGGP